MASLSLQRRATARLSLACLAHPRIGNFTGGDLTVSQVRRHTNTTANTYDVSGTDACSSPVYTHSSISNPPLPLPSRRAAVRSARPFSEFLTDTFNRQHDYLRISITERCNLRCLYCMPEEGVQLSPSAHLLTTPEIVYLSSLFVSQGVTKIRLTGGEPTIRKDIVPMMQAIGDLRGDGLRELCLTTNGILLHRKLDAMAEAGLTGINLSLDTLDPFQFQIMTRRKGFDVVMKSIDRVLEMNKLGARIKLKINCVVMCGLNDREIVPFVEMGREKPIEVRFIEYMPFGGNKWSEGKMFPYQEMLAVIRKKYPNLQRVPDHKNNTSKTYQVPGFEGRVGFITSMTHDFCSTCNRLRITSDGNLKVCLHGNTEVSLRDLIRKENNGQPIDQEAMEALGLLESGRKAARIHDEGGMVNERERELLNVISLAVKRKKAKHAGIGELEKMENRPMILIDEMLGPVKPVNFRPSMSSRYRALASSRLPMIPVHLLPMTGPSVQLRTYSTQNDKDQSRRQPASSRKSRNNDWVTMSLPLDSHPDLPHLTPQRTVHMTNIDHKRITERVATARCYVYFSSPRPYQLLSAGTIAKGNVFSTAQIAGIMAAKRTPDIVPLCHPGLGITGIEVDVRLKAPNSEKTRFKFGEIQVTATVSCIGRTGVEMEAMTAVTGAALTVYDMCKAVDKDMVIGNMRVSEKKGGESGHWILGQQMQAADIPKAESARESKEVDVGNNEAVSKAINETVASDDSTEGNLESRTENEGSEQHIVRKANSNDGVGEGRNEENHTRSEQS